MNINATLFGQMITFGLFVWFTMKLVWPPIIKALDERQNTIANGLAAAERGQKDLALAQRQALDELREARAEGHKIVESAQKRGSDMIDEAKRLAHEEGKRLQELAQIEIEQERHHARNALSKEVAALALLSAERILGHEVSDSVNKKIIDDMVSGL